MIFLGSIEIGLACEFLHTQRHFGRTFILPRSRGAAFLHSQDPDRKSSVHCSNPDVWRKTRPYRAVLVVATLRDDGVDCAGLNRLGGLVGVML